MVKTNIEKNKLYKFCLEDISVLSKKVVDAEKENVKLKLSKKEQYKHDLFFKVSEIEDKLKDLEFSLMFLSAFPNYKPWRKRMMRKEYIEYHLECYYINIICLFDRILHLLNFVYDLGLHDRYVTLDCISRNTKVDKKLVKVIKKIDKHLIPIRKLQNQIKHKAKIKQSDLFHPSVLEFLLKNDNDENKYTGQELEYMKSDMDFLYRDFLRTKKKEVVATNKNLNLVVISILDYLFERVKTKYSKL